jgi:serine/threonine protein kinase
MLLLVRPGDIVASKYRLSARLGQGGMGAVWSAEHTQTGRTFAIKFLHAAVAAGSEDAGARFLQEARASAKVRHPAIIDIFDVGETDDGTRYLVMELLDGMSLADAFRLVPPMTARELMLVLAEVAGALRVAHAAGVVHRDIKPQNIFLHRDPGAGTLRTKVLDFGVSKLAMSDDTGIATHSGSLLGSPRYMAPEQVMSAAAAQGPSDLWSIGVLLFEALTGRFPHDGDSSSALLVAIATTPPRSLDDVAPHVPAPLRALVNDLLQPAAKRIASAGLLRERLLTLLGSVPLDDIAVARSTVIKFRPLDRPADFLIESQSGAAVGSSSANAKLARGSLASMAAGPASVRPPPPAPGSSPGTSSPVPLSAPLSSTGSPHPLSSLSPSAATREPVSGERLSDQGAPTASDVTGAEVHSALDSPDATALLKPDDLPPVPEGDAASSTMVLGEADVPLLSLSPIDERVPAPALASPELASPELASPEPGPLPASPVDPADSISSLNVVRGRGMAFGASVAPPAMEGTHSAPLGARRIAIGAAAGLVVGLVALAGLIALTGPSSPPSPATVARSAASPSASPIPTMLAEPSSAPSSAGEAVLDPPPSPTPDAPSSVASSSAAPALTSSTAPVGPSGTSTTVRPTRPKQPADKLKQLGSGL